MRLPGRLLVVLRSGESLPHVPSHIDYLLGAARPATEVGGRRWNDALSPADGHIVTGVYHARRSLGRVGRQHHGFDEVEEGLGLSRTYSVQLADASQSDAVVQRLKELDVVESASVQTVAAAPFSVAAPLADRQLPHDVNALAAHEQVRVAQAHDIEPGDSDVWVGLVDTGISLGHPEFQRRCLAGYDTVNIQLGTVIGGVRLSGWSRGGDFEPRDEVGHGSHVGGIIGAHGWEIPAGVAGKSMLLPVRVLAAAVDPKTKKRIGVGALSDINEGIKVAVDLGADVLNLSFGTPAAETGEGPPPHRDVITYATHYGCTLVAAMGNSGAREAYYPAAFPEVIAVGSVDRNGQRSAFSTFGDHIALSAPGESIVSATRHGYDAGSGTSYAAPFVTGAAALLVAHAKRKGRRLDGAQVRDLLTSTAASASGAFNPETGHGVLQIDAALRRLDDQPGTGGARP